MTSIRKIKKWYKSTANKGFKKRFETIHKYPENVKYVILGRRTKWKVKACFKIIKEDKRCLADMWHRQYDRMIT